MSKIERLFQTQTTKTADDTTRYENIRLILE